MLLVQLSYLVLFGILGMIFNWLLILAIQRKTYYYQYSHRLPSPTTTKSLLRPQKSLNKQVETPLLPSIRSSISIFDRFILAFLINDTFVCNFLLPLRFLDLYQGLSCGFLCFLYKFIEKFSTSIELIIITCLLISTLYYFWKNSLLTPKLWLILLAFMLPNLFSCLLPTLTFIDTNESEENHLPPTCKQTFFYIHATTEKTVKIFSCLLTFLMILINLILLIRLKYAIRSYKKRSLKILTEAAVSTKPEPSTSEQASYDANRRRSRYYSQSITTESSIAHPFSSSQRSNQPIDYMTYLTIVENSETLVRSTFFILLIYFLVHIPYWFDEFSSTNHFSPYKDLLYVSHIIKPFCYFLTNEKYRQHVWAVLQCKTFRMLPNLLRRQSRIITLNNTNQ